MAVACVSLDIRALTATKHAVRAAMDRTVPTSADAPCHHPLAVTPLMAPVTVSQDLLDHTVTCHALPADGE